MKLFLSLAVIGLSPFTMPEELKATCLQSEKQRRGLKPRLPTLADNREGRKAQCIINPVSDACKCMQGKSLRRVTNAASSGVGSRRKDANYDKPVCENDDLRQDYLAQLALCVLVAERWGAECAACRCLVQP